MADRFTSQNTEGFTDAELSVLNAAMRGIMDATMAEPGDLYFPDIEASVSDAINNAFVPGITAERLIADLSPRFIAVVEG